MLSLSSAKAYLSLHSDDESPEEDLDWDLTTPSEAEKKSPKVSHRRLSRLKSKLAASNFQADALVLEGNEDAKDDSEVKANSHVTRSSPLFPLTAVVPALR
eukprot:751172-Hanusia_phi.AAC.2